MKIGHLQGILLPAALAAALATAVPASAQEAGTAEARVAGDAATDAALDVRSIEGSELIVRLAPLRLEALEAIQARALDVLEEHARALADAIVEHRRLAAASEPDAGALDALAQTIADLVAERTVLASRATIVIDAVEAKGGDVAAAKAYVSAIAALAPDESVPAEAPATDDPEADVRKRVTELVAIVRAEPPVHERAVPWDVPLSELELELQPLPLETVLERLEKWREILQREIRKRVRIDILLNDSEKLEAARAERDAAALAAGVSPGEVELSEVKSLLAERSQEQQRIINEIVRRMEVAILLVKRRGGETTPYTRYIAAATGQKLNLTDPSVLRAQVFAWLRSPDGGLSIGINIAKFVGIVAVFWLLSRVLGGIAGAAVRRVPRSSSLLGPVLVGTIRRVTMFIGLVIGVSMLGVNIGPLLAMIGAAGLVIGLALQGTLSNFASGILILLNRPYDVGHVINAGGVLGKVEAMNLVSTSILTFDNQLMLVPNNQIWNGVITNVTGKSTRRVDMLFGIGYGDDVDRAMTIIREVIEAHPKVRAEPAPTIKMHELGDNSVNVIARPWAATEDYWEVYWDVMHAVKRRFDAEDINIPYPQRDVHLAGPLEVTLRRSGAGRGEANDGAREAVDAAE